MRNTLRSLLCGAGTLVSLLPSPSLSLGQQPPPQPEVKWYVTDDYELPPARIEQAWSKVPIVVRVRIRHSEPGEKSIGRGQRIPFTHHTADVLEILKGTGIRAGSILVVGQQVGRSSKEGVKVLGRPRPYSPSNEYVMFLELPNGSSVYEVAWGTNGAFHVDSGSIRVPPGARKMWDAREEMPVADFLATLRALRDKPLTK